ncbi:hypothetical protein CHS0354_012949 [Potamilus streckersoni]|nr:hypothetical protein CHS0354_012949 [Potamilus streckersoni]
MLCTWILKAEQETHVIQMEVLDSYIEFQSECRYDRVEAFDGNFDSNTSLGYFCGNSVPSYVTSENYMMIKFTSDNNLVSKGFRAQYKSGPRDSLLGKNEVTNSTNIVAYVASVIGSLGVVVLLIGLAFAYIKSAKAKRRRILNLHGNHRRGHSIRTNITDLQLLNHYPIYSRPPPPSYGNFYESPSSPPPAYSEDDPQAERSNSDDRCANGGIFTINNLTSTNHHERPSFTSSTLWTNPSESLRSGNELYFSNTLTISPVLRDVLNPRVQEGVSSGARRPTSTFYTIQCTTIPNQVEFAEETTEYRVGQTSSPQQTMSQIRGHNSVRGRQ